MGTIIYILLALLLLGIMVTVHELGHFCAARACGIAVRAFGEIGRASCRERV